MSKNPVSIVKFPASPLPEDVELRKLLDPSNTSEPVTSTPSDANTVKLPAAPSLLALVATIAPSSMSKNPVSIVKFPPVPEPETVALSDEPALRTTSSVVFTTTSPPFPAPKVLAKMFDACVISNRAPRI